MPQDNTTMQQLIERGVETAAKTEARAIPLICQSWMNMGAQIAHTHYTAQLEEKDKRIAELEAQIEAIRDAYGLRE